MSYDFKASTCRKETNAEKYTARESLFGTKEIIPVWVADMDIDTPDFVLDAVKNRLENAIVGYEEFPKSAINAQISWMSKHHNVLYEKEDIYYSHSVVASMGAVIDAFSEKGEGVIVQTPVYPPFFHSVLNHDRRLIKNPLKQDANGVYNFDINDLKSKIDKNTKLLLLCNPHNPVGRSWHKKELEEILNICLENNIVVFSDEVHCDLVYEPNKHTAFSSLDGAKDITITAIGVGKTFNMAGFAISTIVVQNEKLKKIFLKIYKNIHFAEGCVLSHVAFQSAYNNGEKWLSELKVHLLKNYNDLLELLKPFNKYIKLTPTEATYLAWLDCRNMGLSDKQLREFFVKDAGLGLNAGISFGREGKGFMRLNFAVSCAKMATILEQLENALKNRYGNKDD